MKPIHTLEARISNEMEMATHQRKASSDNKRVKQTTL